MGTQHATPSYLRGTPAPDVALTLRLDGDGYRVAILPGPVVRLERLGDPRRGETYDLAVDRGRVACTCGDYVHRRAAIAGARCKHGEALVRLGLLDPSRGEGEGEGEGIPGPGVTATDDDSPE